MCRGYNVAEKDVELDAEAFKAEVRAVRACAPFSLCQRTSSPCSHTHSSLAYLQFSDAPSPDTLGLLVARKDDPSSRLLVAFPNGDVNTTECKRLATMMQDNACQRGIIVIGGRFSTLAKNVRPRVSGEGSCRQWLRVQAYPLVSEWAHSTVQCTVR